MLVHLVLTCLFLINSGLPAPPKLWDQFSDDDRPWDSFDEFYEWRENYDEPEYKALLREFEEYRNKNNNNNNDYGQQRPEDYDGMGYHHYGYDYGRKAHGNHGNYHYDEHGYAIACLGVGPFTPFVSNGDVVCVMYVNDQALTWQEANDYCEGKNGYLVEIEDSETTEYIQENWPSENVKSFWTGIGREDGGDFKYLSQKDDIRSLVLQLELPMELELQDRYSSFGENCKPALHNFIEVRDQYLPSDKANRGTRKYQPWGDNQPSQSKGADCVMVAKDGNWYNKQCSLKLPFICQSRGAQSKK